MPKPLPRVPYVESPFLLRAELLTVVPHSMATVDRLEADGKFPKRIRLEPTNRVAWLRREVTAYLRQLAKRRQPATQEDQVKTGNQNGEKSQSRFVARSNRSGPTPEDQPANPTDLGFERFLRVMPNEWRQNLERRAGGQMLSREKTRHPNTRLKNFKLKLVGGTEASAPH